MSVEAFRLRRAGDVVTRWTAPKPAEPVHGFVMRLAALHYEVSATAFVRRLGVSSIEVPERYLGAIGGSQLAKEEHLASLRWWTPRFPDGENGLGEVAGQEIRRFDWSMRTRRFCPACLAEDAYHRSWFDLTFVGTCPFHGLPLEDVGPDGVAVSFHSASLAATSFGLRLERSHRRVSNPPLTIEAYALERMGLMESTRKLPMLDGVPLWQVVEAADVLGRLRTGGWSETAPPQGGFLESLDDKAAGFACLAAGRDGIEALFRDVARRAPPTARGERQLFGWITSNLLVRGGLCETVHAIGCEVAVALGRQHRQRRPPVPGVVAERVTMLEVARLCGRSDDVVTSVVTSLGLMLPREEGSGYPFFMESRHLDRVREALADTLSRTDAAEFLGLEAERFNELGRAGFFTKLGARWGDKHHGGRATGQQDRFERSVLQRFLDDIPISYASDGNDPKNPALGYLSVAECINVTAYDAGEFFADVFGKLLVVDTVVGGGGGLRDFRMRIEEQPQGHAFVKRCMSMMATRGKRTNNGMSIREAGAILEVDAMPLGLLVDQGLIPTMAREGREQYRIDREGVLEFHRRYATAKVWAAALEVTNKVAPRALKRLGILPAVVPVLPEGRAEATPLVEFYERDAVDRALALACNPEATDWNRMVWKRLAAYMGQVQSSFTVWRIYDGAALVSDSNAEWPMNVSYVFEGLPGPVCGDVITYGIDVRLRIAGKKAAERIKRISKAMGERCLHPAMEVDIDEAGETLEARILIVCTAEAAIDAGYSPDRGMEFVADHGESDVTLIDRAAHTLRASLEPSGRVYDYRFFGPPHFHKSMLRMEDLTGPPLVESWRSPRIQA